MQVSALTQHNAAADNSSKTKEKGNDHFANLFGKAMDNGGKSVPAARHEKAAEAQQAHQQRKKAEQAKSDHDKADAADKADAGDKAKAADKAKDAAQSEKTPVKGEKSEHGLQEAKAKHDSKTHAKDKDGKGEHAKKKGEDGDALINLVAFAQTQLNDDKKTSDKDGDEMLAHSASPHSGKAAVLQALVKGAGKGDADAKGDDDKDASLDGDGKALKGKADGDGDKDAKKLAQSDDKPLFIKDAAGNWVEVKAADDKAKAAASAQLADEQDSKTPQGEALLSGLKAKTAADKDKAESSAKSSQAMTALLQGRAAKAANQDQDDANAVSDVDGKTDKADKKKDAKVGDLSSLLAGLDGKAAGQDHKGLAPVVAGSAHPGDVSKIAAAQPQHAHGIEALAGQQPDNSAATGNNGNNQPMQNAPSPLDGPKDTSQQANADKSQLIAQNRFADALTDKIGMMLSKNLKHAHIQLDPPELGSLMIRVQVHHHDAQVQFQASHAQTREWLQDAMPKLKDMMAGQGFNLADGQVRDQANNNNGGDGRQGQWQGQNNGGFWTGDEGEVDESLPYRYTLTPDGLVDAYA
ncbi:flagellar hook-length control protein FliK [Gallaecimonas mangrovi]|uniref:flagellar hook-length control protein FliK n=1 Tax=Gallaecimonas mangrovi TaxID=2291597 RepID=UPI000E203CAA|nr:flagellar hook-length control protein FliK [Gallaecimonas mangrovi]